MPSMGRTPTTNLNLPPRMRARRRPSGIYYFYDAGGKPRKEIPLGNDYMLAIKRWSELQQSPIPKQAAVTWKMLWDEYMKRVLVDMPANTQEDYLKCSKKVLKYFSDGTHPVDETEPYHIAEYMVWRKDAQTRANRERSLISTLWNNARSWGYTNKTNPCQGIARYKEKKRTVYIEDEVYNAVYKHADQPTRDALDLGYLTAQRPGDVTKLYETDMQDGQLAIQQGKTGAKLRIDIIGELKVVINRILTRKAAFKVRSLKMIVDEYGKPLSQHAIWKRFDKARAAAAVAYPKLKDDIEKYWITDLRAKGGTDVAMEEQDIRAAQKILGHSSVVMTERYVRDRKGQAVKPTK